jgi:hypothetical protein
MKKIIKAIFLKLFPMRHYKLHIKELEKYINNVSEAIDPFTQFSVPKPVFMFEKEKMLDSLYKNHGSVLPEVVTNKEITKAISNITNRWEE